MCALAGHRMEAVETTSFMDHTGSPEVPTQVAVSRCAALLSSVQLTCMAGKSFTT